MRVDLFDYELPPDRIAQHPVEPRDAARLLVVDRAAGTLRHGRFRDLGEYLRPGDHLVLNDTRVVPARLQGARSKTGGRWEGLFLREVEDSSEAGLWELMTKTRGKPAAGERVTLGAGRCELELVRRLGPGRWLARPHVQDAELVAAGTFAILDAVGTVPLPPYIRGGVEGPGDRDRYQTVFAERAGSVAAPTASLHFTAELLTRLADQGVQRDHVTLHVGPGTFQPVKADDTDDHVLHHEWCELTEGVAERLRSSRAAGGRVVAVGTTTVRTLESASRGAGLAPFRGETNLFIKPPYDFRTVDVMVTNFHLPRSTLLMLVCAFAGTDLVLEAYREAVREGYRFYSYGDAMLLL